MSDIAERARDYLAINAAESGADVLIQELLGENERLRGGLDSAIRAATLALFVIRKQGAMPNSSWESGLNHDLAMAAAAREQAGNDLQQERHDNELTTTRYRFVEKS